VRRVSVRDQSDSPCKHEDVRYTTERAEGSIVGHIACFGCGRLFGALTCFDYFIAHNPGYVHSEAEAA
jgi:hypothetical protein